MEIKRIYKDNRGIYGASRIHHILGIEGFNASLKRIQRLMAKLGLYALTVKKYKPYSNKKIADGLENVLKRDFSTNSINEKWVGDITYIHTIKDGWCYLASVLDLHSKKIIGYAFAKRMTNDLVITSLKNAYSSQAPNKNPRARVSTPTLENPFISKLFNLLTIFSCYQYNILNMFSHRKHINRLNFFNLITYSI